MNARDRRFVMSQSNVLDFAYWRQWLRDRNQEQLKREGELLMTEQEIRDLGYQDCVVKSIFDFVN